MIHEISNREDLLDVRSIIERVEELREQRDAHVEDATSAEPLDEDDAEDLSTLEKLLDDLAGYGGDHQWEGDWYPVTLIRDSYFVEAMKELVEDIGDMPNGVPSYVEIDWEATARNLRVDYTSVEFGGVTYWYR